MPLAQLEAQERRALILQAVATLSPKNQVGNLALLHRGDER